MLGCRVNKMCYVICAIKKGIDEGTIIKIDNPKSMTLYKDHLYVKYSVIKKTKEAVDPKVDSVNGGESDQEEIDNAIKKSTKSKKVSKNKNIKSNQ
jgi:hypothetical protein